MNKGCNMKTDLYSLIQKFRGDVLVEVETLNTHIFVKVNKGDFLNQIACRGITLNEMEAREMFGPGQLYVSKIYK
jgi:hypothetical protein